jgi:hypothetical protein
MDILANIFQIVPFFALIGTYLLILAYSKQHLPERVKKRGIETEGTIVEIRKEGLEEFLVVDFTYTSCSNSHFSNKYVYPSLYKVGQKVKIWYYFHKSNREVILEDEGIGNLPSKLYRWGFIICIISYPFLLYKLFQLGW